MANDRCRLKCKICGESMMLAKHMGDSWYTVTVGTIYNPQPPHGDGSVDHTNDRTTGQRLEEFVDKHGDLLHGYEDGKEDRQPFEIEYEVTEWVPSLNAGPRVRQA